MFSPHTIAKYTVHSDGNSEVEYLGSRASKRKREYFCLKN